MKKFLSAIGTILFSFTVLGHTDAVQQILGYHLPTRIMDGSIEPKVRANHAADETEQAYEQNMNILQNYYLPAWLCASGKDRSKCRPGWQGR